MVGSYKDPCFCAKDVCVVLTYEDESTKSKNTT